MSIYFVSVLGQVKLLRIDAPSSLSLCRVLSSRGWGGAVICSGLVVGLSCSGCSRCCLTPISKISIVEKAHAPINKSELQSEVHLNAVGMKMQHSSACVLHSAQTSRSH